MTLLNLKHVEKEYRINKKQAGTLALRDVTMEIEEGEFVALMGESGSGKSTLLNLIATLDTPTGGVILFDGQDLNQIPAKKIAAFRRHQLGFVFQSFNLLGQYNNRENIALPLVLSNTDYAVIQEKVNQVAEDIGITDILDQYPYEVSGGQQQRVAVARALVTEPKILLADEPTGALDSTSADALMSLFNEIHKKGQTILMVTHSHRAASFAKRILFIKDGVIFHELYKGDQSLFEFQDKIGKSLQMLLRRD